MSLVDLAMLFTYLGCSRGSFEYRLYSYGLSRSSGSDDD